MIADREGLWRGMRAPLQKSQWTSQADVVVPLMEPIWDPNDRGMPGFHYYKKCVLVGVSKGVPKQKKP